jgi:hypothetical protein
MHQNYKPLDTQKNLEAHDMKQSSKMRDEPTQACDCHIGEFMWKGPRINTEPARQVCRILIDDGTVQSTKKVRRSQTQQV